MSYLLRVKTLTPNDLAYKGTATKFAFPETISMPKVKPRLRQSHKISFCPDCGKRFANETRVLQHMNQPSSACGSWMENLSRFYHRTSAVSNHTNIRSLDRYLPGSHSDMAFETDNAFAHSEFGLNNLDTDHIPFSEDQNHAAVPVVDTHPNVPSVYPGGTTFMDQFFNDEYSRFRHENIYYPFASEVDWQLASWLLRSHLSMAAIDTFLSLKLVRCLFSIFIFRLKRNPDNAASHFFSIGKGTTTSCRDVIFWSSVAPGSDQTPTYPVLVS